MPEKKIIAVVGATGAQGGGVVRAIMRDKSSGFTARALTRDVNSDKARALAQLGAEVVQADVDDAASLERAFAGASGAYCVTFFWAHMSAAKEIAQAHAMAHAAKQARQIQSPALRRQSRGQRRVHRPEGPDHVPAHVLLLGEPDARRWRPAQRPRRRRGDHVPYG